MYIFIDVDGTLVEDNQNIPESAVRACRQAKEKGHMLFLCTGRSKAELYPEILNIGFDGIIGAGGGFIEYQGEMIRKLHVETDVLAKTLKFFDDNSIDYYIESNEGLFASAGCKAHLGRLLDSDPHQFGKSDDNPFLKALIEHQPLMRADINKICFLSQPKIPFTVIAEFFNEDYEVHHATVPAFGYNSGELAVKGVSKSNAISILLDHINGSQNDTMAIGDGDNDLDMLAYCRIGVAMGNATKRLQAIADWIAPDVSDHGLHEALKHYQIID